MTSESCIRCGNCKALCPTYIESATEGMGGRGRTVLLTRFLSGEIGNSRRLAELLESCILCGACDTLCPLGISITDLIYRARKAVRIAGNKSKLSGFIARSLFKNPSAGFSVLRFLDAAGEIIPLHKFRPFKPLSRLNLKFPDSTLREGISIFKVLKPKGRIAIFAGCTANYLHPYMGKSLIRSLNALAYDVVLPKGESCCGAPLMGLGLAEDAAELAERNLKIFKKLNIEAVIGLCPTCVHFIKNEYRKMVGDTVDNAVELSQFFSANLKGRVAGGVPKYVKNTPKTIYHAPCHSVYSLGTGAEPKQILKYLGIDLIDSPEEGCCGFGGTFSLSYPELSSGILERRFSDYTAADQIVTSCPNCVIQLRSRIKDKPIRHIIEIIEEGLT